jgi:myo-inositol-1-phosphate synthase
MTICVAIMGLGNCACSFMQGLTYYDLDDQDDGLILPLIGGYRVSDIKVVAAFDIAANKVGRSIRSAIWALPNNTRVFSNPPEVDVTVARGPTLDGLGRYLPELIEESSEPVCDVAETLRSAGAEVVVNYLPVGADEATRFYANAAISAGCAFVNCMPSFIASEQGWQTRFQKAGLPVIGDDVKSQVGATIVHRALAQLFRDRGVHLSRTSQLNVGGNSDFYNMLERDRLVSKRISKTQAVTSVIGDTPLPVRNVHIGPSDHVPWLEDRKWAYIRLEGEGFGGSPINIELKLEVWDSPNSAGVVVDAVRCAKVALDRKLAGYVGPACAYYMKSPPKQCDDEEALRWLKDWLDGPTP